MEIQYYILIFLIGLALGSFFNVILFRYPAGRSVVKGRSKCFNCQSTIRWFDLVPLLSYFILRGKCRVCKKRISPIYPFVEISTATALLSLFLNAPEISYLTMLNALIVSLFILTAFFDIRYFIIPDKILILMAISTMAVMLFSRNTILSNLLISGLGLASFFAILFLVSRGKWLGLGDVKLILIIGLLLGYPLGFLAIVSSIWAAAIFSILLLATGKANLKTKIPFGSFLSATAIIFIIFSHELQKISKYFY